MFDFIIESTEESINGTKYLIEKYKDEKLVKPITTSRFAPGGRQFFGKTGSFEEGYYFDALAIEDDKLVVDRYFLEDRLERFIYLGDDRNICARYVEGNELK